MSLVRGLALANNFSVLRRLYGEPVMERVERRLTEAQRAQLSGGVLPGRWYDEDIVARTFLAMREIYDDAELFRFGVAIGQYHVSRGQRWLARVAGPRRLLQRAQGLWSYWRDTGRMAVEDFAHGRARVVVYEHPLLTSEGYPVVYGAASAFLVSLSGAKDVRIRVQVEGADRVAADLRWDAEPLPGGVFHAVDAALASLPR